MVTFLILVVIPVAIFFFHKKIIKSNGLYGYDVWEQKQALPKDLRQASIYMSEQKLTGFVGETKVFGTVDQVFLNSYGKLVVVDTKTRKRHRVYDSDINQISLYAFLLGSNKNGYQVEPHGYIRTVIVGNWGKKSVQYHKVHLKYRPSELFSVFA